MPEKADTEYLVFRFLRFWMWVRMKSFVDQEPNEFRTYASKAAAQDCIAYLQQKGLVSKS